MLSMQTASSLLPQACFLNHTANEFDIKQGRVGSTREAPPALRALKGYALHTGSAVLDLTLVRERVIIVCATETAREIGMVGTDLSATGIYQQLPSGHLAVLLPWSSYSKRRKRSEMWRQYFTHGVARAQAVARGEHHRAAWGRLVQGEGEDVVIALKRILANPEPVSVDVETVGEMPDMKITAIGLAVRGLSVSVPWDGYLSKTFGIQHGCDSIEIRELVAGILASAAHAKIYHNGGFDRAVFASLGMPANGAYEDTILQMKILYNELYRNLQFSAGLAGLFEPWKDDFKEQRKALLRAAEKRAGKKTKKTKKVSLKDWREIPLDALLTYNCKDAAATLELWYYLVPKIAAFHRGEEKYAELRQLSEFAADMWLYGVSIDFEKRNELVKEGRAKLAKLVWEFRTLTGPGFPPYGPGSAKKLHKLFFEKLKAPVIARNKPPQGSPRGTLGSPSLNTFTLTCWDVAGRQPLADIAFLLFRIRKQQKSLSAFLDPIKGDRIYPSPNVVGTLGTRLSYQNPNLQQWPKDLKMARFLTGKKYTLAPNMRSLVIAPPGKTIIEADYQALEVLAVAYRTRNDLWLGWMADGVDMHTRHVELMYGIKLEKDEKGELVDPDGLRQVAKVTVFSRNYNEKSSPGAAVKQLKAKMPSITEEIVTDVYERFDAAIPFIADWHVEMQTTDATLGYVETATGGHRLLVGDKPDANRNRSFEIQSSVGDIVVKAMLKMRALLDPVRGQRMLYMIHDSFVVECNEEDKIEVGLKIREAMEWLIPQLWSYTNIRLPVDMSYGPTWEKRTKLVLPPRETQPTP